MALQHAQTPVQPAANGYAKSMARTVEEIMTTNPRTVNLDDTVLEAARVMRDNDIGDVIVVEDGQVTGIVTDRDIVVRAVAEGRDPESTPVGDIATTGIQAIEPKASVDDALRMMREHNIRRLPTVKNGRPVGIVSLGDLAVEREPGSTLADISAAAPDQ
jgi:CBS domain-containing protein